MVKNVFSEPSDVITVLVHTKSFLSDSNSLHYFNNANRLKSIRIYYMPISGRPEEDIQVNMGVYKHTEIAHAIYTSIEFSDYSVSVCVFPNSPGGNAYEELDEIAEDAILRNMSCSQLFDYIVASDTWCKKHSDYNGVISFSEIQEILRLFLINKKQFEFIENYYCDETLYYTYRLNVLFIEYQSFWSATIESKNNNDIDTANALGNRLLLFSMCMDNARIEAYKTQNNTTAMHIKYHISYLLLLITGSFDSLAWIINNLYGLGFEEKKQQLKIDLVKDEFRKAVKQKSVLLSSILVESDFINRVKAIRELRDRIVHRNFLDTASSSEKNGRQDYLWIDQIASDKLLKAGFDERNYYTISEDFNLIHILSFLKYLQNTTTDIVNRFLKIIATEKYHCCDQCSISKMLGFPSDSYVL